MKFFFLLFAVHLFSNFSYAEILVRDSLDGKMLLCENTNFQEDLSNNPNALIIKDVFIKFHSDIGFNLMSEKTEFKAEVSMMGFVPSDFYSGFNFKEPLEMLALGSISRGGISFLTNKASYNSLTISDAWYVEDLPLYKTTTENIFIGYISLDEKGFTKNFGSDYQRLTDDLINYWLKAEGFLDRGGIVISRKTLKARFTYSWFPYGKYGRTPNEIEDLSCKLNDKDIQQDMFELERRHYEVIKETKKQIKKNDLKSKEGNLL